MTTTTHTDAEVEAAWAKAIADQNRLTAAQAKLPSATAADADLSAEEIAWKKAMAAVQGSAT